MTPYMCEARRRANGSSICAARQRGMQPDMIQSRRNRREWRIIIWVSLASAIVSAWFGYRVAPEGQSFLRSATHGVVTCLVVGTPIIFMQIKEQRLDFLRRMRRLPLAAYFAFKVVF